MSDRTYSVEFTAAAAKQLRRLDRTVQLRILKATALLARHPRPPSARRLASKMELWRVRVGDYRIVYGVDEERVVIAIARVGHRASVYRDIG